MSYVHLDQDAAGGEKSTRVMLHYAPHSEVTRFLQDWKHHAVWVGRVKVVQKLVSQGDMNQLYASGQIGLVVAAHPSGRSVRIAAALAGSSDEAMGAIQHNEPVTVVQLQNIHEYIFIYASFRCGLRRYSTVLTLGVSMCWAAQRTCVTRQRTMPRQGPH